MVKRFQVESADADERLGEAVEQYMALAESGNPPDMEAFASQFPDLGEDLVEALEGLSLVRGLVGVPGDKSLRLEAGRRLAGYRIVRELGSGGMGVVYEAVHVDLDRPVALKVLDARATRDSNGLRRFQEEAKMAAGLHHTHIVPVFDVGHVGGLCYYAMQRIEGSGLDRVLRSMRRERTTAAGSGSVRPGMSQASVPATIADSASGSLSWPSAAGAPLASASVYDDSTIFIPPRGSAYYRWVAEAGRQAAQALAHAHRRGVIHRDIKPSNLLVDGRGTIWVTDFGLARRLADPSLTRTDSLLGTPRYMSPEQARPGPIDGRTDVYSLGATLYEMLALRPPFDGRTAAELIQQISDREPPHPREHDPRIPRDLETIVLKALAKRPSDRYADAAELAEDLTRFIGHEPVLARRIGPIGRAWRLARRHPAVALVSTAATIAVVTVATVAYVRVVKERDRAVAAELKSDNALKEIKAANQATQEAMRQQLLSSAALVRMSHVSNRRESGLGLLSRAADMNPGQQLRTKLRDEAVQFLSIRDVEARPEFSTGPSMGLAFGSSRNRLATLSEDGGELRFWDVAKREIQGQPVSLKTRRAEDVMPQGQLGSRRDERSPRQRFPAPFVKVASTGPLVAVVWQNSLGIHFVDASSGGRAFDMPTPAHEISFIQAAPSAYGPRLVTVDREPVPDRDAPAEKGVRPRPRAYRVNLWDPGRPDAPLATLATKPLDDRPAGLPWPFFAISPYGDTVATFSNLNGVGIVSLWSGKDGKPLGEIETDAMATALALGPDNLLAVASGGAVRLWQVDTKTPLPIIAPQLSFITMIEFSPDGSLLAVAGRGRDVELWDPAADTLVAALPTAESVTDLSFSADGRTLIVGQPKSVAVWAIVEPTVRSHLSSLSAAATSLAFGPNGVLGMASFWDGSARFWDSARCPTSVHARTDLQATALAGAGEVWLAASPNNLLRLSSPDRAGHKQSVDFPSLRPYAGPPGRGMIPMWVHAIATTPNGQKAVLTRMGEFLLWSASEPDRIRAIVPPSGAPRRGSRNLPIRFALAPKGDRLYSLRMSNELSVWSLSDTRAERVEWNLPAEFTNMALSPDGKTLALSESSGVVVLVDTARGTVRSQFTVDESKESQITALLFSPDSRELAVGTKEGIVRLWQVHSGRQSATPIVRLPGHRGAVITLAYEPGGNRLASAGEDKTVDVWDLAGLRRELKKLSLGW